MPTWDWRLSTAWSEGFRSNGEFKPVSPSSPAYRFERDMIRERTNAGLAAAKKRGGRLGRPKVLTPEQIEMARTMFANPQISSHQVAEQFGVHRATLYRHLNAPNP